MVEERGGEERRREREICPQPDDSTHVSILTCDRVSFFAAAVTCDAAAEERRERREEEEMRVTCATHVCDDDTHKLT